ncbi:Dabb family protein [Allorhodopirellula solitaria]|uniref:Stress responsive A/B Barrel Domain protein n=1 Tax=Allorhodopirellula solitaria TaxID=2527987 RepID=A0A5C5XWM8_9BACT|nr:Dabb family protein [Allorhodopirellula solitaria]TWT66355.1 Stress responsive A/B Barrel Domain protein [Allorhodopirellula solitaria]
MKSTLCTILALGLIAVITMQFTAVGSDSKTSPKKLRHMVMFSFKDSSSEADVQGVVDAFVDLPSKISSIAAFEHGENNSPEGLNDGLTHCFLVTFDDEAGRAEYLPHPAHKAFVEILKPHLEKAVVVDYWAE